MRSNASSPRDESRSPWVTSSRRSRSATPAPRPTSFARTRTSPHQRRQERWRNWAATPLHCVSEAVCKPSSVPRLLAVTVIPLDRRLPDDSCGRPEGWAARLSPTTPHGGEGCALLFGLAPGRVCRVSPRRPKPPDSSLWHCSSPRGGRGLPATLRCGARTFLEPQRRTAPARDRPTASLTAPS